ncbi:MAG TPA: FecR domain-containing protein [Gemmatimonadaceae bacterium]|nr:FecR domain-containing protein [Gemmatimonadaceae bacterium]
MLDEVLIRVLQGQASDIEKRHVLEWRNASPRNARRFRELATVWELAGQYRQQRDVPGPPTAADIITRARRGTRRSDGRRNRRLGAIVAAGIAAALLVLAGLHLIRNDALVTPKSAQFVARELTTNAHELVTVRLDDGTVVRLGPNSHLRFGGPSRGPRDVSLDGRAYFAVAKDKHRPFRVHTSAGDAQVLGTRFELQTEKRGLRLLVVQGRVELDAGTSRAEVHAGQMTRVNGNAPLVVVPARDAFAAVDQWVGQVIFFEATPLDEVARELSRHYHRHVMLVDSSLAHRTVTASFINRDFTDVMTVVCRVTDVRCRSKGTSTTISRT